MWYQLDNLKSDLKKCKYSGILILWTGQDRDTNINRCYRGLGLFSKQSKILNSIHIKYVMIPVSLNTHNTLVQFALKCTYELEWKILSWLWLILFWCYWRVWFIFTGSVYTMWHQAIYGCLLLWGRCHKCEDSFLWDGLRYS